MNRFGPTSDRRPRETDGPPDEEYARAYSEGYGEGLREAFRELLSHASRGHTAQELRMLVESRLARIREDVEFKRRSLLVPPRRPDWGSLLRGASRPPTILGSLSEPAPAKAAGTYLWWEPRPQKALEFVLTQAGRFPRVVWISVHAPPEFPDLTPERLVFLRAGARPSGSAAADAGLGLEQIAGEVRRAVGQDGGALVYLEAVEFLSTEYQTEGMHALVNFLATEVSAGPSALAVSADPEAFAPTDRSRLGHSFRSVVA